MEKQCNAQQRARQGNQLANSNIQHLSYGDKNEGTKLRNENIPNNDLN